MIYLGTTVFRSQLPLFQLIDGESTIYAPINPEPLTNPGVYDLQEPANIQLYMILGSDYRPESGYRTDILMLMAVDSITGKISLVSFPRDLWVTIPGFGEERINTVMQIGGFQLLADTMQANFGVYPTQFAMIDMEGFIKIIDELGGISFVTDVATADACDGSMEPDRWCEIEPGEVTLDSTWALWYVRARYNSSDFDRMRRTQEVVSAVVDTIASPRGLIKLPRLIQIYDEEVVTNINPDNILPMARLAAGFDSSEDIRTYSIGPNEATNWWTAQGAAVLIPNTPAIQLILESALNFEESFE
jgi:LCP family protein required for cell wall assembly